MMSKHIKPWNPLPFAGTSNQHPDRSYTTPNGRLYSPCSNEWQHCCWWMDRTPALRLQNTLCSLAFSMARPTPERCWSQSPCKVNCSIDPVSSQYQWSWCCNETAWQGTSEARFPRRPIPEVTDLEAAIRQLRQLSCIFDSCTISASYEVSQAQKAILFLPHTAKGASTSSEGLKPRTDDEHNLPACEDYWQEY